MKYKPHYYLNRLGTYWAHKLMLNGNITVIHATSKHHILYIVSDEIIKFISHMCCER
jgi:hypothetical protein